MLISSAWMCACLCVCTCACWNMYTCTYAEKPEAEIDHGCTWVYFSIALSTFFFFFAKSSFLSPELTSWLECWPQSSGDLPVSGPALGLQISIVPHHPQLMWCWRSELSPSCLCGRRFLPDPSRDSHAFLFSLFRRFAFAALVSFLWTVFPSRKVWAVPSFHRKSLTQAI